MEERKGETHLCVSRLPKRDENSKRTRNANISKGMTTRNANIAWQKGNRRVVPGYLTYKTPVL